MSFPTLLAEQKMFDKLFRYFSAQFYVEIGPVAMYICTKWSTSSRY